MRLTDEPHVILNADGTIADANEAALELYGATLAELRAAPQGAFTAHPQSPEEREAFRKAWDAQGKPDLVGEATLRRPDGNQVRVRFGLTVRHDGRFLAILQAVPEPAEQPTMVFTAGQVLAHWRAAERELEAVPAESPEASLIKREIERFRKAYQLFFRSQGNGSPA